MEQFYRRMRTRHAVLMSDTGKPAGGQWNFDHDNREAWNGIPWEPADLRGRHDHSTLWQTIQASGAASFGEPNAAQFGWPLNQQEALQQLERFVQHALPHFGRFQDAMSVKAWRLFHSLLSFAMNVKMLSPRTVVERVEAAYRDGAVPLASAEGYIRQILGWREYVRGVYWHRMPGYDQLNAFDHHTPLPPWFWDGQTRMRCVAAAIGCLLARNWGLSPDVSWAILLHHDYRVLDDPSTDDAIRSLVALSLLAEKGIQRLHNHHSSYEWEKGGESACRHLGLTEDETEDLLEELNETFHTER